MERRASSRTRLTAVLGHRSLVLLALFASWREICEMSGPWGGLARVWRTRLADGVLADAVIAAGARLPQGLPVPVARPKPVGDPPSGRMSPGRTLWLTTARVPLMSWKNPVTPPIRRRSDCCGVAPPTRFPGPGGQAEACGRPALGAIGPWPQMGVCRAPGRRVCHRPPVSRPLYAIPAKCR